MDETGTWQHRVLLIGRAHFLGLLCGAGFGEVVWGVLGIVTLVSGREDAGAFLALVVVAPVAGIVGGIVGGTIGLTAGLALALSGRRVLLHLVRSQLVTGSGAAAVPLAVALNLPRPVQWGSYAIAAGVAAAGAVTAMLLTRRILHGPPPPARCMGEHAGNGSASIGVDPERDRWI